jgi:DNA-binding MarR family transcriptional regulator
MSSHLLRPTGMMASPMTPPTDELLAGWHELRERHARATTALERALEEGHQLGVSEYEVLERLAAGGEDACRMQSLNDAVHLSQSALSRVVGRLETAGLVERKMCADDRRGIFAALTPAGRERYEAARPTHRAVLAEVLGT